MNSQLPIFRSPQQLEVLAYVMLQGDETSTIPEIVRATGVSQPTVWREVKRLAEAGVVKVGRTGRSQVIKADRESTFYRELWSIALKLRGPIHVAQGMLAEVPGVEAAFLFGSWAERYLGVPGPPPADLDVVVVGTPDPDAVESALRPLEPIFGLPVNPVVVSPSEWEEAESGFLRQVKKGALVPILGAG